MGKKKISLLEGDAHQPPGEKQEGRPDKLRTAMAQLARRGVRSITDAEEPEPGDLVEADFEIDEEPVPQTPPPQRTVNIQVNMGGRDIDRSTYDKENPIYIEEDVVRDYVSQLTNTGITDPQDLQDLASLAADASPWTEKQLRFLEFYFQGRQMHVAAKLAGYRGKTKSSLCTIGAQVLEKLELRQDHRQIWRRLGLGEARLGAILVEFLQDQSKSVRLEALKLAMRGMGLMRDVLDVGKGATIIIGDDAEVESPHEYKQDMTEQVKGKPLRITK